MSDIVIAGYGPNDKVPGPVTDVKYGVGGSNAGSITQKMLIVATKASTAVGSGSATPDFEVFPITRIEDAIAKADAGSELARVAEKALRRKVQLFGVCPALTAPTAATMVISVAGTWTTAGSWALRIGGDAISSGITKSMNPVAVAASIAATITGKAMMICSAQQGTNTGVDDHTVTLTIKSPGVRGNQTIAWVVPDDLPAGCTIAILTSAATPGSVTATGFPKALTDGMTYVMQVNGVGSTTKTVVAKRATLTLTGGSYAAGASGETVSIRRTIAGTPITTVVDLSTATDQASYTLLLSAVPWLSAAMSGGDIVLTVDQAGSGSAGAITAISGASVTTKLGASVSTFTLASGSNVSDADHVTPAELALVLALTGSTLTTTTTTLTWSSNTTGTGASVQFLSGTGVSAAGFDTALHTGSPAVGGTTVTGGGCTFSGGAGVEDVSNVITTIANDWYNYLALAENDSTNLQRWLTFADDQAAPFTEKPSFLVLAMNGNLSTAASRAQNDLNNPFFQLAWMLHAETHPSEIAGALCALRCETEQTQPNSDYDGIVLLGVVPLATQAAADIPNRATQQLALDEGVTPLLSNGTGVSVVRSITTLSLSGNLPFYGCLDTYQAVVPQRVRIRLKLRWFAHRDQNKFLRPDPMPTEPTPPEGVTYPQRWNAEVIAELKDCERDLWISGVVNKTYLPRTQYDPTAERLMTESPIKVLGHFHQTGLSVLQVSN